MATIVNIFGKLYTFLRRPQPENENVPVNQSTESTAQNETGAKKEISQQEEHKAQDSKNIMIHKKDQLEKMMTDSAASSDWEHIPEGSSGNEVIDAKIMDDDQFEIKPHLLTSISQSGTDVDAGYTEDLQLNQQGEHFKREIQDSCGPAEAGESSKQEAEEDIGIDECGTVETDVDKGIQKGGNVNKKDGKPDSAGEKGEKDTKKGTDGKVCKYYRRGQNCWKGKNCKFMHAREKKLEVSGSEEVTPKETIKDFKEDEFDSYVDFVSKSTECQRQISPKDLFYKLGCQKGVDTDKVGDAVLAQYQLAKSRNNWHWVKQARYFAELFFAPKWIDDNLPQKDQKSNRKSRPKKKEKYNLNEQYENPTGLCRDFRLKDNPDMQTVTANAAGDSSSHIAAKPSLAGKIIGKNEAVSSGDMAYSGKHENVDEFITDYTDQVIQEAMKMAINDGLSESAIMEVIEDVTSTDRRNTPHKRVKPAKVDLSRTPRIRPEQLALGFNYHSDLVVKQSPKTVKGEIIPLDTLPQPRERPEQLAVGFNYLAEQLVKESPKSETGEIIIPGVVTTPRRLARDQLAIGFNYHSNLIAKDSSNKENLKENGTPPDNLLAKKKNDVVTLVNGTHNGYSESNLNEVRSKVKSAKRSMSDTFAVGFSYNSDQMVRQSLDELNGNVSNGYNVSSLIEDAVISEDRNMVEVIDELPVTGLPAGSVW